MDARITKPRLSNLMSYDWIKIICVIVAAIIALMLVFAVSETKPLSTQKFYVYAYTDVFEGENFGRLSDRLSGKNVFSYDILEVGSESFSASSSGSSVYQLRRSVGLGNVLFVTDEVIYQKDEEGNVVKDEDGNAVVEKNSTLCSMALGKSVASDEAEAGVAYDTVYYMDACERYLVQFFGDDWRTDDTFDGVLTPADSFSRNANDKRYKTDATRAQGLEDEKARLKKLREDYLVVDAAFDEGLLSHTCHEDENGNSSYPGINLSKLKSLRSLVYYNDSEDDSIITENLNLMLLFNSPLAHNDLRFESISFLRYLVDTYKV